MVRLLSPVSACTLLISVLLSSVMSDILIIRKNHICQVLYIDQRVYVKLSLNNESLKHRSFNITAKEAILLAILLHGKEGISGKDLEYQSGVSRQTINQERVVLKRNGLIEYKTSGKRTTYFPTKKALEDRYFRSWIYGKELFNKLDSRSVFLDSPFYDTNFSLENKTEKLLFEFSLRLGSILTYMFLQVMNPAFIKDLTFNEELSSKEIKDYLTKDWIKNIINPIRALTKIRQSLYLLGYKFEVRPSKEPKNYTFYELETKSFEKLLEAFAKLYPYVYKELEKVNDDLSKTTESWKKTLERAGCKHEYKMEIKGEHKYFECCKCETKITIQSSGIIKDQKLVDKMNNLKRPQNANCIKFGHQWENRTGYQVDCVCYICPICGEGVTFSTDSQEKMGIIDEEVSIKVGIGYIELCRDIEYFFHRHSNEEHTINDFLKFFKDFRISSRIEDLKAFKKIVSTIIDILIEHRYLKLQIPHNNLLKRVYKREYQV